MRIFLFFAAPSMFVHSQVLAGRGDISRARDPVDQVVRRLEDRVATYKMECLRHKIAQVTGIQNENSCRYNFERRSFIQDMKRDFCSNPIQFCEKVKCLTEDDRMSKFTNHRCEGAREYKFSNKYAHQILGESSRQRYRELVMSEERKDLVREKFQIAKDAVISYLRGLRPPPREVVIDRIRNTELMNLDDLDSEEMTRECQAETGFERPGMMNHYTRNPSVGIENTIHFCPQELMDAVLTDPNSLLTTFMHELGHSVDPCTSAEDLFLAHARGFTTGDCEIAPSDTEWKAKHAFYKSKQLPFAECLYQHSYLGRPSWFQACENSNPDAQRAASVDPLEFGPQVRRGNASDFVNLLQTIREEVGSSIPELNRYTRCAESFYRSGGSDLSLGAVCPNFDVAGFPTYQAINYAQEMARDRRNSTTSDRDRASRVLNALEPMSRIRVDQTAETFADHISAGALPFALRDPRNSSFFEELSDDEKASDVMTMVASKCEYGTGSFDPHPSGTFRLSVYAQSPEIRRMIGCPTFDNLEEHGIDVNARFPSRVCTL